MIEINSNKPLVLLGDTHSIAALTEGILYIKKHSPTGVNIFHVGDTGFSFDLSKIHRQLDHVQGLLEQSSSHLYAIRGNHDLQQLFGRARFSRPSITLLDDYQELKYADRSILAVGGAVSVDRGHRLAYNWPYDPTEMSKPVPDSLTGQRDIVIAHDVPEEFFQEGKHEFAPYNKFVDADKKLSADCKANRETMTRVLERVTPTRWFAGHYHRPFSKTVDKCAFRIIAQQELLTLYPI